MALSLRQIYISMIISQSILKPSPPFMALSLRQLFLCNYLKVQNISEFQDEVPKFTLDLEEILWGTQVFLETLFKYRKFKQI